jgi:hypothetical protein
MTDTSTIDDFDMMEEAMCCAYPSTGDEMVASAAVASVPRSTATAEFAQNGTNASNTKARLKDDDGPAYNNDDEEDSKLAPGAFAAVGGREEQFHKGVKEGGPKTDSSQLPGAHPSFDDPHGKGGAKGRRADRQERIAKRVAGEHDESNEGSNSNEAKKPGAFAGVPDSYESTPGARTVRPGGPLEGSAKGMESSSELTKSSTKEVSTKSKTASMKDGSTKALLTAYIVEEKEEIVNENVVVAVAKEDSCCGFLKQNRRAQLVVSFFALVVIGMAVGLGVAFSNNEDKSGGGGDSEEFFELVGGTLDGPNVREKYGVSLSLSQDGKRMVTSDLQGVQIFDLLDETQEEDGEDWVQLTEIPIPFSNLDAISNVMIRSSVEVDISRDGKYVAIGWPFASSDNDDTNAGRVEVYVENSSSGVWERLGDVLFGEAAEDFFGASVSLSQDGGVLAVGGPGNSGLVKVYLLNAGIWIPRGGEININGTLSVGSVSLSAIGDVLAVGGTPTNADEAPAVVRVFQLESGEWLQLGEGVDGNVEDTAYQAGLSGDGTIVAVSNYYIGAVGSAEAESNDALDARALQWSRDLNQWVLLGENLHASAPGPKSGYYISLSDDGTIIAMSDPGTPGELGGGVTGHAHIYKYDGESWMQTGPNQDGEAPGDQFGFDVSISGDGRRFAVGAPFNRGSGLERGRVYVYGLDDA